MYEYNATVVEITDGDTVVLDIDLGMRVVVRQRCRILSVNTPELHSQDAGERKRAEAAKKFLEELLGNYMRSPSFVGKPLVVTTQRDHVEKYGRYLVQATIDGKTLAQHIITAGHGVSYDGGRR